MNLHYSVYRPNIKCNLKFLESGHGKCAADGIRAVVKRTLDSLLALGKEISHFNTSITNMVYHVYVIIFIVSGPEIIAAVSFIPKTLEVVPKTVKIHQITWHSEYPKNSFNDYCFLQVLWPQFPSENGYILGKIF